MYDRKRTATGIACLALTLVLLPVAGCDSDEESSDTTADMAGDMGADIESCPATGATLQAAPLIIEVGPVEAGMSDTASIAINNAGDGQLCFGSTIVELAPAVDSLTFGPLMVGGEPSTTLNPGQMGRVEVTYAPTARESGQATATVISENGGDAQVQISYEATGAVAAGNPIGSISLSAATGFIFDEFTWRNDATYRDQHPEGVLTMEFATGTLDEAPLPTHAEAEIRGFAIRNVYPDGVDPYISFEQWGYAEAAWQAPPANPILLIHFPNDSISAGTYDVDASGGTADGVLLVLREMSPDLTDGCIAAVGKGTLSVTEASQTSEVEGGTLALEGTEIPLYHPQDTPDGDVSPTLWDKDFTVCSN